MIAVELVGGPRCGEPARIPAVGGVLPLALFGRYLHVSSEAERLGAAPRYEWDAPSGGMRGQCSCRCDKPGCPNYGVDV